MKKIILVTLTKNYQRVELSCEIDTTLAVTDETDLKNGLLTEAAEMLQDALRVVDGVKAPEKATSPQQVPHGQLVTGKSLSPKQIEILKENNLWRDDLSYDDGRALLDEHFNNKAPRAPQHNQRNNYNGYGRQNNFNGNRGNFNNNRGGYNGNNGNY